jgi:hypothetical protein
VPAQALKGSPESTSTARDTTRLEPGETGGVEQ